MSAYLFTFSNSLTCNTTKDRNTRTIVGRVDGELDDGVADVCLRFSGGESLFGGAGEGDVEERGDAGRREERVPAAGHSGRRWRLAILRKEDVKTLN